MHCIIRECVAVSAWMPLSVIETPSGEIRLAPWLEYRSKLEIVSFLSWNCFKKTDKKERKEGGKASVKARLKTATTLKVLSDVTNVGFCHLLHINVQLFGWHVSSVTIILSYCFLQCLFLSLYTFCYCKIRYWLNKNKSKCTKGKKMMCCQRSICPAQSFSPTSNCRLIKQNKQKGVTYWKHPKEWEELWKGTSFFLYSCVCVLVRTHVYVCLCVSLYVFRIHSLSGTIVE